jgi:fructose-bisphosphate aldolase class 1
MSASFSRALSEGVLVTQSNDEFNKKINQNIEQIVKSSD